MEVLPSLLGQALIYDPRERARRFVGASRAVIALPLVHSDAEESEAPSTERVETCELRLGQTSSPRVRSGAAMGFERGRPKAPLLPGPGWKWLYTRGYNLEAPAAFALRWMEEHTGPRHRGHERALSRGDIKRTIAWTPLPPDGIAIHQAVKRGNRVALLGEDRYRFLGGASGGCIVEVSAFRRPVSLSARLGFLLGPMWSAGTRKSETELLAEIERDFRRQS